MKLKLNIEFFTEWGEELYAEIEKLVDKHSLDPRRDCVVSLFKRYSDNSCKIQDFIDGPLSIYRENEEVRLIDDEYSYFDEFSVGIHPNGNILLGPKEMINEYIDDYAF